MLINVFLWRLTKGLAICGALLFSATSQAQHKLPALVVSLEVSEEPFHKVLELLSEKSALQFSYSSKKIPIDQLITYKGEKLIEEVLNDLMRLTGLEYELVEKQIVLRPLVRSGQKLERTLYGYINDKTNGEALIGATIIIEGLDIGTMTNTYGFYSLTVPKDSYQVTYTYLGYKSTTLALSVDHSHAINVELEPEPSVLNEVVISASTSTVNEFTATDTYLTPKAVDTSPALLGEGDMIKSLGLVCGIKPHSDGSTFYYVRGGNKDQNLLLIDDAPIYNPSHMLGIFSTVIPDAVNNINIYKGNMPASMGGRLSAVIDVQTKKGNMKSLEAWGNVNLLSTRLGVEGPIKSNKSSYLVSTRFSHIKWLFDQDIDGLEKLGFLDFTTKLNFKLNERNKLYFSTYIGGDNYFENNSGIQWSNAAATLRWNKLIHNRLFLNSTLSASAYDYFLHTDVQNNTQWKSHIANINLKTDFTYFTSANTTMTFGAGLSGHNFNPGNLTSDNALIQAPLVSIKNASELVLYGDIETKATDKLKIRGGIRISSWNTIGSAFEFLFDENHRVGDTLFFNNDESYSTYTNLEPRVEAQYQLAENKSLAISLTKNVQNVHLISNSISPFTSLEVWLPSSINIKPQIAHQVAMEYVQSFPISALELSGGWYYKKMKNQIDYAPHAETLLNPLFESELRFGESVAYGVELVLKKKQGKATGWLGYSYSRVQHQFEELNEGRSYNASYDRPHEINIVYTHAFTSRWSAAANWTYYTGAAFSSPTSFFRYNGLETPIYSEKNNARLPDYHRLDLSLSVKLNRSALKKFQHTLSFSIFNAYARKNTLFINYNKVASGDRQFKIPSNILDNTRLITETYLFGFTPALSYSFRFK